MSVFFLHTSLEEIGRPIIGFNNNFSVYFWVGRSGEIGRLTSQFEKNFHACLDLGGSGKIVRVIFCSVSIKVLGCRWVRGKYRLRLSGCDRIFFFCT